MKQQILLILLLALLIRTIAFGQSADGCTPNESWISIGGGLSGAGLLSTEMNGELYVLHRVQGGAVVDPRWFAISRWNGSAWKRVTDFRTTDNGYPTFNVLKSYNGDLYLGGTFTSFNGDKRMHALVRWDGSNWSSAAGSDMIAVYAMEIHNGELYASMEDWMINGHILRWNGTAWDHPGGTPAPVPHKGRIAALLSWNGALYAGGAVPSPIWPPPIALKWDGNTWTSLGDSPYGVINQLFVYNDTLYAAGRELSNIDHRELDLIWWDGSSWQPASRGSRRRHYDPKFTVHKGELYAITPTEQPWLGHTYYRIIDRFDGTTWHPVSTTNGTISMMGEYRGDLFIAGNFSASCGGSLDNIAMLCNDQNCGRISGTVYYDFNGNCTQALDERPLAGRIVKISPGDQYTVTDRDGKYSRYVLNGDYTVALTPHNYWERVCPVSPGEYQVTVSTAAGVSGKDFGARPIAGIQDLRVSVAAGRARQGRQLTYAITYQNVGTVTMNGTVRFHYNPLLQFDSASVPITRSTSNRVDWDFTDLAMEESRTIHVWTTVPVGTSLGTEICSWAQIDPAHMDTASIDNRDSVCVPVTGSYDPNDIRVTPFGVAEDGVITQRDSILTYWVRFQNTGNDTAFKVFVVDSLGSHVDISSIKLGAARHPYTFSIDKSNMLVWTFNNIMLPDSNANEPNSHGYFKFSVKLKPNLPVGTEIPNRTHIYFDYNDPVATNTVVSILGATLGVDRPADDAGTLSIYPNPAHERVTIGAELRTGSSVTLRTLLGETLRNYHYDGSGAMTIDLRELLAGTYLITAETPGGVLTQLVTVHQ